MATKVKGPKKSRRLQMLSVLTTTVVGTCIYVLGTILGESQCPWFCHAVFVPILTIAEILLGLWIYNGLHRLYFMGNPKFLPAPLFAMIITATVLIGDGLLTILRFGWPTWNWALGADIGTYVAVTVIAVITGIVFVGDISNDHFNGRTFNSV